MGYGEAYCESGTVMCAGAVRSVTKHVASRFCMTDGTEQNLLNLCVLETQQEIKRSMSI